MNKITRLLATAALLFGVLGGVSSVKAYTVVTKTPVLLNGGKFAECFSSGTYFIQMQGWQSFIAYQDATGISFNEDSYLQFDLKETVQNGNVRLTFTFNGEFETKDWQGNDITTSTLQVWWCLGTGGEDAPDNSTPYYKNFDESKYWLKKGFDSNWDKVKDLKITNVTVDNFNLEEGEGDAKHSVLVTYNVEGGTICGQPLTIKQSNALVFGAYGGEFTATDAQSNIFQLKNFDVGDYQKMVIKFGEAVHSTGGWNLNNNSGLTALSEKTEYEFELDGTAISDFTIFNLDANPDPINISEVYLYKEEIFATLNYDESGKGVIDKGDLFARGGLSYNPSTGELASDGTEGQLVLQFEEPVDLRNLFQFNVERTGAGSGSGATDDIVDKLYFYDEDGKEINNWSSAKWSNTWNSSGINNEATNAFINNKPVKKLVWKAVEKEANDGMTKTITSVQFFLKTISCSRAGETQLKTLPYNYMSGEATLPSWNMNTSTTLYYGSNTGDAAVSYADVTNYSEIRIYRDDNTGFRAFFINSDGTNVNTINNGHAASSWNAVGKYWSIDLSKVAKYGDIIALQGIKSSAYNANDVVRNIVAYKTPAANAPQYTLLGSGMQLAETVAALADETATCIDATGVTGITTNSEAGRTLLTSANPNCLFLGTTGNGGLANTQNVVDGDACTNLVLVDNYPFKAPSDFTANTASYTTTINTTAQVGTLCLPFAATIPDEVTTAWTLSYTSGDDKATANKVTTGTIGANTPVLLNGSGKKTFTGTNVEIDADAANTYGALTGVFELGYVPVNSYILQNQSGNIGFYKVVNENTNVIKPFRAYLTADGVGPSRLSINFVENDEPTGVGAALMNNEEMNNEVYNLSGQRVEKATKGLYIKNGKKVIMK